LQPLDTSASAPDAGIYSRDFNARTYQRLRDCAANCLRGRESVIVDAASLRCDERELFLAAGREHAAEVKIVHCVAPLEVLKQRVAGRVATGTDASEATVALLDRQPSYWEPFGNDELRHVLTVDTTAPDSIERALRGLAAPTTTAGSAG
jgi:predicted kinase